MSEKTGRLPRLGMRTVKTAICVFICLFINFLIDSELALYSSIVAIVCMQSTIENTLHTAINRVVGTAIGGGIAMLLIWALHLHIPENVYLLLIPAGIILVIYLCNVIKMPGSSVICAIVFLTVMAAPFTPSSLDNPYLVGVFRITDTLIGIGVAMTVNRFIKPPVMFETRKVHLECNTYDEVFKRVEDRLSGAEQLILYDSSLTCDLKTRRRNSSGIPLPECEYSVRVPVPMEYADEKEIPTAHITADWTVTPMYLRQTDGYVDIPCETLPCTVVWQSVLKDGLVPLPPPPAVR